jgi:FkbM family methyltransferase
MKNALIKAIKKSPTRWIFSALKKRHLRVNYSSFLDSNKKMLDFYRTFVSPGDLVFDIGANYGNRAKVFSEIGASVIAFEPQPVCFEYLKAFFWMEKNVLVEPVALGERVSSATMKISKNSLLSTLSVDYIDRSVKCGRFSIEAWQGSQEVQVSTLDYYIQKYGCPKFAKIDVEGFEFEVLKGLSEAIPFVSLEFATENRNTILNCIDKLSSIREYVFQFSAEESFQLHPDNWSDVDRLKKQLNSFNGLEWGDIYCLQKASQPSFKQIGNTSEKRND